MTPTTSSSRIGHSPEDRTHKKFKHDPGKEWDLSDGIPHLFQNRSHIEDGRMNLRPQSFETCGINMSASFFSSRVIKIGVSALGERLETELAHQRSCHSETFFRPLVTEKAAWFSFLSLTRSLRKSTSDRSGKSGDKTGRIAKRRGRGAEWDAWIKRQGQKDHEENRRMSGKGKENEPKGKKMLHTKLVWIKWVASYNS